MIYFITQQEKFVKIGVGNNPEERLATLQTGNPHKLTLWFCIPGGYDEEKILHHHLDCIRISGEWFILNDYIREFAESIITNFSGDIHKWIYTEKWVYDSYPINQDVIAGVDKAND